jgi:hypothetical protein
MLIYRSRGQISHPYEHYPPAFPLSPKIGKRKEG